jgi:hypothetical protein
MPADGQTTWCRRSAAARTGEPRYSAAAPHRKDRRLGAWAVTLTQKVSASDKIDK